MDSSAAFYSSPAFINSSDAVKLAIINERVQEHWQTAQAAQAEIYNGMTPAEKLEFIRLENSPRVASGNERSLAISLL